jgi:predicted dehydrogenase
MRFLVQDLSSGATSLVEGPAPNPPPQGIVVRSVASLVSSGTERMLVDFGRANLVQKAMQQPERVREVVDKARTDGVVQTVDAVRSKLAQPIPLGYANAGVVVEVGARAQQFRIGQLVATSGSHAEVVAVPATLAAAVPDGVPAEAACFASVAAVGLEAIRLAAPTIGERFVVTGLGLVGLLTVQLLRAQGCAVLGVDPAAGRRALAEAFGAETAAPDQAESAADRFSRHRGVDGVLVCASTRSSAPIASAAHMCRTRGRVVLVGVTGLDLDRADFYAKEITFQVSCSFGAGRNDARYEAGNDYPFGHVRWTAGRNMEAVLDLLASGALDVGPLISHRFPFAEVEDAYRTLVDQPKALGLVLEYPTVAAGSTDRLLARSISPRAGLGVATSGRSGIALIGAGNYASRTLVPALNAARARLDLVAARSGTSAALLADREDCRVTSDVGSVFDDPSIGTVFIATRHDSHAGLAAQAIRAGMHVYVEKPLALTEPEVDDVVAAVDEVSSASGVAPVLAVGFNRRFAPLTVRMRALLAEVVSPKAVVITVNAGHIPADHWTQDPLVGGGRIVGEGCHFIDLARHLVGSPIVDVATRYLGEVPSHDSATIALAFADGSTAAVNYLANGAASFAKERVEVFTHGRVLQNDNFRTLRAYGWPGQRTVRLRTQDKGHKASVAAFLAATTGDGPVPVPFDELIEVSRAVIEAGSGGCDG